MRKPEVQVAIDRDRPATWEFPCRRSPTLERSGRWPVVSRYKEGTEQYDVWLRADKQFRANPRIWKV